LTSQLSFQIVGEVDETPTNQRQRLQRLGLLLGSIHPFHDQPFPSYASSHAIQSVLRDRLVRVVGVDQREMSGRGRRGGTRSRREEELSFVEVDPCLMDAIVLVERETLSKRAGDDQLPVEARRSTGERVKREGLTSSRSCSKEGEEEEEVSSSPWAKERRRTSCP